MKIHEAPPSGTTPFQEVNVAIHNKNEQTCGSSRGFDVLNFQC